MFENEAFVFFVVVLQLLFIVSKKRPQGQEVNFSFSVSLRTTKLFLGARLVASIAIAMAFLKNVLKGDIQLQVVTSFN